MRFVFWKIVLQTGHLSKQLWMGEIYSAYELVTGKKDIISTNPTHPYIHNPL